jgi:hypothetical protein
LIGLDDQRIIIFGGAESLDNKPLKNEESLYTLNLINFEWNIPKTAGQIPSTRMYHTANVIGKYMVISFGKYYILSIESIELIIIMFIN